MHRSQPANRHLSAARRGSSNDHHTVPSDILAQRRTGVDYGMDNFSYDPDHLSEWHLPSDLRANLPQPLLEAITEWQYAGAAVITALDRIDALQAERLTRGFPSQTASHLQRQQRHHDPTTSMSVLSSPDITGAMRCLSTTSMASPPTLSTSLANTPPVSYPVSPIDCCSTSATIPPLPHHMSKLPPSATAPLGIDSPPITPVDSLVSSTPAEHHDAASFPVVPDADQLAGRLSPLFRRRLDSSASSGTSASTTSTRSAGAGFRLDAAGFDPGAWETYANALAAEIGDLKARCWPRFKARGYGVRKAVVEVVEADAAAQDDAEEVGWEARFEAWWGGMKGVVARAEDRMCEARVPSVERMMEERGRVGLGL